MNNSLIDIEPVKPVAPWFGGKARLAKTIISKINQIEHNAYAEPFIGMGGIFLRRNKIPQLEIINDLSTDVSNFFRVLQNHYQAFMDMIKWQLSGRDEWNRLMNSNADTLTDLQRAARFLYIQRLAFSGKVVHRYFSGATPRGARFDVSKLAITLEDLHQRLSSVLIEKMNWEDFVMKYDSNGMLFYCDPPYFGCENQYGNDLFDRSQFELMADIMANSKSKFLVSINDNPEIRNIFKDFNIERYEIAYGVGNTIDKGKKFGELLISN